MISWIIKTLCLYYLPQPSASADNTDLGFDNSWYHAQPHPIIVYEQSLQVEKPRLASHFKNQKNQEKGDSIYRLLKTCENIIFELELPLVFLPKRLFV